MHAISYVMAVIANLAPKREEKGATAVEYGLLVALIAAIIVGVVAFLGQDVRDAFAGVVTAIPGGNA